MNHLTGHRLPLIEECIKALANCREAAASTTLISPHRLHMSAEQVSEYTKHELARHLAVLLVDDAEITESIVWSDEPGRFHEESDSKFTARTVVMKASTYHTLCQALRHLRTEASEDKCRIKA